VELLAGGVGGGQDEREILVRLGDFAVRREIAREHLAAFLVHDLRVGRRAARHLEEGLERKAEAIGEDEPLRQGGAVQTEDEVDGELRLVAVAERAEEKAALADGGDNVVDLGDARLVSRQEANTVASRHLLAAPR
jgi:hypothetical protein